MQIWTPLFGFALFAIIFGFGDYISSKTKGLISGLIVGALIYMVGFWTGIIPKDTITVTGLPAVMSAFGIPLMITSLGTMMNLEELAKEWKTVLIALAGIAGVALMCFTGGSWIFGRVYALAAAAPISGGIIAAIITSTAAVAAKQPQIGAYAMLICSFQIFIGMPVASYMLKKEAQSLLKSGKLTATEATGGKKFNLRFIPETPKSLQSSAFILGKLGMVAFLAATIANMTLIPGSKPANYYFPAAVAYLVFGVLFTEFGLLEKNALNKAMSFNFLMLGTFSLIPGSFATLSPQQFVQMLVPLFGMLILGAFGIVIGSLAVGKLVGCSIPLSIAIGVTAMIGYPGTQIITDDVVKNLEASDADKELVSKQLLPKMLVGGFVTVTIASVAFAGIIAPMIFK